MNNNVLSFIIFSSVFSFIIMISIIIYLATRKPTSCPPNTSCPSNPNIFNEYILEDLINKGGHICNNLEQVLDIGAIYYNMTNMYRTATQTYYDKKSVNDTITTNKDKYCKEMTIEDINNYINYILKDEQDECLLLESIYIYISVDNHGPNMGENKINTDLYLNTPRILYELIPDLLFRKSYNIYSNMTVKPINFLTQLKQKMDTLECSVYNCCGIASVPTASSIDNCPSEERGMCTWLDLLSFTFGNTCEQLEKIYKEEKSNKDPEYNSKINNIYLSKYDKLKCTFALKQ
jgi:hypothetical protein